MARPNAGASEKIFRRTAKHSDQPTTAIVKGLSEGWLARKALPIAKLTALLHADPHLTPQC